MDDDFITQLNLRIEEHQRYLREQLSDLHDAIESIHRTLAARLDAHEAYHQANEHRWGLMRAAQRHPFRLAMGAFLIAWLFAATLPQSAATLKSVTHALIQALIH